MVTVVTMFGVTVPHPQTSSHRHVSQSRSYSGTGTVWEDAARLKPFVKRVQRGLPRKGAMRF